VDRFQQLIARKH